MTGGSIVLNFHDDFEVGWDGDYECDYDYITVQGGNETLARYCESARPSSLISFQADNLRIRFTSAGFDHPALFRSGWQVTWDYYSAIKTRDVISKLFNLQVSFFVSCKLFLKQ